MFYGKLLDVYHLELEQNYFNGKRWLLNRLVTGYGVICGLDVRPGREGGIVVQPGIAIDKWGREIIVSEASKPIPLPSPPPVEGSSPEQNQPEQSGKRQRGGCDDDDRAWVHIVLCYRECLANPVPALGDDCSGEQRCSPGTIRERYEICLREGKAPEVHLRCSIPDLVTGDKLDYAALARHVSQPCRSCAEEPCIALANVGLPVEGTYVSEDDIDITVRPIVYTNDLLFEIIVGLLRNEQSAPRGGKP
jgi:hypothetical protein